MHAIAAALSGSGQPLPGFLNAVGKYLAEYGYWAILLLVMLEDFGVPVPGETILIAGAIDAGTGRLNVVLVGVIGFVAAVFGDNIGYAIGRSGGRAIVARWGRYILLTEERLGKTERFFAMHGGKIIVIARFVEGLRQANGIIAGISRMHWLRFVVFNALGAALWVGCWVSIGYFGGQHITTIYDYVTRYSLYVLIAIGIALLALIVNHIRKRRRRVQVPAEPDATEEPEVLAGLVATADSDEATTEPEALVEPGAAAEPGAGAVAEPEPTGTIRPASGQSSEHS